MIAYNTDWLDALLIRDTAKQWHDKGLLSDEKWTAVQARYTDHFYSPNIFVRLGLAIFSLILLIAAMGIWFIMFEPDSETGFGLFSLFWGAMCLLLLETGIIRLRNHKGSGIDDMLLYVATGALVTGLCTLLLSNSDAPFVVYCFIALPFMVVATIRYIDLLMAAATFICALLIVILLVKEIPGLALFLLPFSGMLFSAAAYFFARKGQDRYEWRHWHGVLTVIELMALATFYMSGNYWVVQQAGADFFQLEQVPMGWLFWSFTFIVPAAYIVQGLRHKNRHMLDIGLACVGAAVFTFRYYFSVMPLTWAAVIAGAVLFVTAYFSIRYLKQHEGPYTYEEDSDTSMLQEIEQQLIEQTIANQPGPSPEKKDGFGGGQFGGGGAGNDF